MGAPLILRSEVPRRHRHDPHPGGPARSNARGRVFEDQTFVGRNPQGQSSAQVALWVWLRGANVFGSDHHVKV
jgi:hypothetical protein